MGGGRLKVPPRAELPGPDTANFGGLDGYSALMQECWAQNPHDRPSFEDATRRLQTLLDQAGL